MEMRVLHGDCLEVMRTLNENSVDAIVTDPPYGLSFMGKKWDYDIPNKCIWQGVLRVLKPGGQLLSFGGTRTYHRLVCEMEDAGFDIRDQLQWLYGSGFPKSHNLPGGWGTALKPANEPIVLARKPLSEKTVAKNVERWGTGCLNIEASRIGTETIAQHQRDLSQAHGNNWAAGTKQPVLGKTNYTQGRWPANLLLDESAAEMLDEQSGFSKGGNRGPHKVNTIRGHGVGENIISGPTNAPADYQDSGGASRFFYVAKASKRERNAGLEGMPEILRTDAEGLKISDPRMDKPQMRIGNQNHHPTVKPIKLMEYLCRLITPPNGTILDPFMGSGSTGVAAKRLGFQFIGIEMNEEYVEIARRRIEASNFNSLHDNDKVQLELEAK